MLAGVSQHFSRRAATCRLVSDIRVSTGVGALLIMWWGGARVVEYR